MITQSPNIKQAVNTLPSALAYQSVNNAKRVAVREKRLGIWREVSWSQLFKDVQRAASSLFECGFRAHDHLVLLTQPRSEAIVWTLAAQYLGATAVPLPPEINKHDLQSLAEHVSARFYIAEDQQQVDKLLSLSGLIQDPKLVVYSNSRGLNQYEIDILKSHDALLAEQKAPPVCNAVAEGMAFLFVEHLEHQALMENALTHASLMDAAQKVIGTENLNSSEEALAARAFAAPGHARYLLAPWLVAGFTLNFPETVATRDQDRREIAPTLLAGTRETYSRLLGLIEQRLPRHGTLSRYFVDWALSTKSHFLTRLLAEWLVLHPLREVLGLSRAKSALLVGENLTDSQLAAFVSFGIEVRHWPTNDAGVRVQFRKSPARGPCVDSGIHDPDLQLEWSVS